MLGLRRLCRWLTACPTVSMEQMLLTPLAIVEAARTHMEPRSLGILVITLARLTGSLSPKKLTRFIAKANLWDCLKDGEFVEGLGEGALSTPHLIKLVFSTAERPSEAVGDLIRMADAGVLDIFDSKGSDALHRGLQALNAPALYVTLLTAFASHLDSFDDAGRFLSTVFSSDVCLLPPAAVEEILEAVVGHSDVRELAGEPKQLLQHLQEYSEAVNRGLTHGADESDADSEGNLAGFVVDDDESHETSSWSNEDSEDTDGGDGDGHTRGAALPVVAPTTTRGGGGSGALSPLAGGRKRLRKLAHSQAGSNGAPAARRRRLNTEEEIGETHAATRYLDREAEVDVAKRRGSR